MRLIAWRAPLQGEGLDELLVNVIKYNVRDQKESEGHEVSENEELVDRGCKCGVNTGFSNKNKDFAHIGDWT